MHYTVVTQSNTSVEPSIYDLVFWYSYMVYWFLYIITWYFGKAYYCPWSSVWIYDKEKDE